MQNGNKKIKKALVCGAGGFIGGHLVKRLKDEGYYVRGVDIKYPEFRNTFADEFILYDLRVPVACRASLITDKTWISDFDEVYQLAADMGGMGFIHSKEADIMKNNALININMIDAAAQMGIKRYFYSSSVCIYRNMQIGEPELTEEQAYPANPDNEYGWEKLYAERMVMTYGKYYNIETRIARFQNCFGPFGTWDGGREKAPAAICRKVAETTNNIIDVWGDGTAVRSYTYVDDLVDGIYKLMQSDIKTPVNIGNPEYISVNELVKIVSEIANKSIVPNHIKGPVGVTSRNFSNNKIYSLGWKPQFTTRKGLEQTYPWIKSQVEKTLTTS